MAHEVGDRIKRLRKSRGLSQRELAVSGVSYAYISRIESGSRNPSVKALRKIASKLEVPAEYLETGKIVVDSLELKDFEPWLEEYGFTRKKMTPDESIRLRYHLRKALRDPDARATNPLLHAVKRYAEELSAE